MKRFIIFLVAIILVCIGSMTCFAGDVPEGLLNNNEALVFFGEVQEVGADKISVLVTENIKGTAVTGQVYEYDEWAFTSEPQAEQVYLCGYYDENNPLYVWEITNTDIGFININNSDDMSNRMEEYINNGDFTRAQEELLTVEVAASEEDNESIGIIGSADGPTSIYVSRSGISVKAVIGLCIAGVVAVGIVIVIVVKKIRKK